mmetsp:Transcript_3386/g.7463  ORF Transcript_3386/g.7463 Transcript_3386/m.7463 type:complete len:123 (+) Transcript_3386:987-1355(+)
MVKGNVDALRKADERGALPLHVACEFGTPDIVQYLINQDKTALNVCDVDKNYPLHYACRSGNCGAVSYLLAKGIASAENANNKLPIELLFESGFKARMAGDTSYMESIWRLLLSYPDVLHGC